MVGSPNGAGSIVATDAGTNALVLQAIQEMPEGGKYATSREAAKALRASVSGVAGKLSTNPDVAKPSYCSGATYLVFLRSIEKLEAVGRLQVQDGAVKALQVSGQADGVAPWGRWNANGPGTAKFFHDTRMGRSFESFDEAMPGDFMKIFWNDEIGKAERGHSVVFLGTRERDGELLVRFWSSNQPNGYGEKEIPRERIKWAIFSRLEHPNRINEVAKLPAKDPFLASMLSKSFTRAEVRKSLGMPRRAEGAANGNAAADDSPTGNSPEENAAVAVRVTTRDYRVMSGDTLSGLARKFGTSVRELKRLNKLTSDVIQVGQTLRVPTPND